MVMKVSVDGVPVPSTYADVYVVVRDGADGPGPQDWEVQVRTDQREHLRAARHDLGLTVAGGHQLLGPAIVRFSDGHRHLLRGDGELLGFDVVR